MLPVEKIKANRLIVRLNLSRTEVDHRGGSARSSEADNQFVDVMCNRSQFR